MNAPAAVDYVRALARPVGRAETPTTPVDVSLRLTLAGQVLERLPPDKEQYWLMGNGTAMPRPVRTYWEAYGMRQPTAVRPVPPSSVEIGDMEEALGWLLWLHVDRIRAICMARACNIPWRMIQERVRLGRTRCYGLQGIGLQIIAEILTFEKIDEKIVDTVNKRLV